MNRVRSLTVVIIAALLFPACASIVSKSEWPVAIKSTPDKAEFVISNKTGGQVHSGTTPATIILPAKAGYFSGEAYKIVYSRTGFSTTTSSLETSLNGWYLGNLLFGGLIGLLIVDPLTGAMWRLPDEVQATLPPSDLQPENHSSIPQKRWRYNPHILAAFANHTARDCVS